MNKLILAITILTSPICEAATWHSDGTVASVQALHDQAATVDGDKITIPVGTFTWDTKVSITKGVWIKGAGIGSTTVVSNIVSLAKNAPFYVVSNKRVRISHMTCSGGPGDSKGFIWMESNGFRIDHIAFANIVSRGVQAYSKANSWGVIDSCTFDALSGSPQGVSVFGDGDAAWSRPLSLGTHKSVYVEDCVFNWIESGDSAIDQYDGARAVFRYNTVTDASIGCHGLDSGNYRSALSWEIYNNIFNVTTSQARQFHYRGGTGVIFDNIINVTGSLSAPHIEVTCYRATGTCIFPDYNWGFVTGSNPYDGNTDCYGWPALDQIGATPPTDPPNIKDGPPPAGFSVQGSSPAYAWNNTKNGILYPMGAHTSTEPCYPSGTCGDPNESNLLQEGRDFFNDVPKPGYAPLTYPHPLRGP